MDRITEQKLKNKRFRGTEETIISVLLSAKEKISLSRLLRIAHISRSTLHRHHKNISEIVPDYEKYMSHKCKHILMRLMKLKYIRLRFLYERMLIILAENHQIIELILKYGDQSFIEQLVAILKPKILANSDISANEAYEIYIKEVAGLIESWCRAGFNSDAIPVLLDKIAYLTKTVRVRLGPLGTF